MTLPETFTEWRKNIRDKLGTALQRFRPRAAKPAAEDEAVNRLKPAELLAGQQTARQDLDSALNDALTMESLPGGDARFFSRVGPLEQLRVALDTWQAGQPRMVACFGPQGSGISSLLNQVEQLAGPEILLCHHVLQQRLHSVESVLSLCGELFGLSQPPVSVDEALALVRETPARIIVIDNAHQFVLRIAGNAPVIRTLGMLMVASRDRHLWMIGCNKEAWNRLIYLHDIERYFTDTISVAPFSGEELTGMLQQRLQSAGVRIGAEVEAVDTGGESDTAGFAAGTPGELLIKLSNGHPQLAIALLLKTLVPSDDPKCFTLSLPQKLNTEILDKLQPTDLFALAEIAVHGTLSALEHQTIFRCAMTDSQILLADLCHRHLLCRQPGDPGGMETYQMQPVLAPFITAHLYKKNMLY